MLNSVIHGDCLEKLKVLNDNSVDAVVTDPPYGLSFMNKKWDYDVPSVELWAECLRVLKPGGYLLAFAGTRTQHRMAVRIEDAGFEIRDMIAWVYGSGFPKSLNIGKAIDKLQGNEREIKINPLTEITTKSDKITQKKFSTHTLGEPICTSEPISEQAKQWEGWGTALKPALEPITVARKPLSEKSVAENCLKWGTGGINIDECRVEITDNLKSGIRPYSASQLGQANGWNKHENKETYYDASKGRFPANLIHDGSDEVMEMFPETKQEPSNHQANSGSAARFFYCAKASKSERNKGLEEFEEKLTRVGANDKWSMENMVSRPTYKRNTHPTVKPIKLMEYLVKLVSRENALILDPFGGK